jgi:hypothetical protein
LRTVITASRDYRSDYQCKTTNDRHGNGISTGYLISLIQR